MTNKESEKQFLKFLWGFMVSSLISLALAWSGYSILWSFTASALIMGWVSSE